MFFDLVEEVIPASYQTTLVLVVHQVELIRVPHLTDLRTKKHKMMSRTTNQRNFIIID